MMEKTPLKVQQLINLLLAMNPRAEVLLYGEGGALRPLTDEDVQEIYAPEQPAKTVAHIGVPAGTGTEDAEGKL
ncbi:hypothetical protein [Paenibacillus sp. MMS20-IR301]|uniref:hypothetical protein n=1 Tax=Paenibacillus sp. MMS20-IR301 TaxID=2895946 RepID=UPI0028F0A7AB|nr:hypothetical protein [Paenibacillus sp. MMS20-IR301]WNS41949.1 hypothetical protein LOS79_23475 [Paenibacillus sp. MMS20-IR301]